MSRLAYVDGPGQRVVLPTEGCQGLPKERPAAAGAHLPWCLGSSHALLQSEGPGQPPPPIHAAAAPSCCKGRQSQSPSMETLRPALLEPAWPAAQC